MVHKYVPRRHIHNFLNLFLWTVKGYQSCNSQEDWTVILIKNSCAYIYKILHDKELVLQVFIYLSIVKWTIKFGIRQFTTDIWKELSVLQILKSGTVIGNMVIPSIIRQKQIVFFCRPLRGSGPSASAVSHHHSLASQVMYRLCFSNVTLQGLQVHKYLKVIRALRIQCCTYFIVIDKLTDNLTKPQ